MGFFGSDEDEDREEVTIGLSEDSSSDDSTNSTDIGDMGLEPEDNSGELEDDVSKLDTVRESVGDTSSEETELDDIRKQNQKIIKKLDTVISKL
ncbi:MAG: hypothetical protein J07AB43_06420 [Candidatus Nanosalina sp. J07AB43]|nr:MAG: hypothetical protein J07AB43_06420 [Candidatus Nanosalina sp. J07AB43]